MMYYFCAHGAMPKPCNTCIIPRTSQEIDQRIMGELHYSNMPSKTLEIPDWDLTQPHSLQSVDGKTYMMEHNTLTSVIGEWPHAYGQTT